MSLEWIEIALGDSKEIVTRMESLSFENFKSNLLDKQTESYLKYSLEFVSRCVEFNIYNLEIGRHFHT